MDLAGDAGAVLVSRDFKDAAYAQVGAVAERKSHKVMAGVALAKGTTIRASLTHLEGGNVLVGTQADGEGYALVGRDSLAQSRYILAKDRGKPVSDAALMAAVAHDLGIKPQHVVAVEQPGDFHLDMHMMPVAPGEVMVNDPVAAQQLSEQWERADHLRKKPAAPRAGASAATVETYNSDLAFWKELGQDAERNFKEAAARAQKQATAEERSIRDLEKAGIKVHRVPAVFGPRHAPQANFINAEQGTNPKGERFYIALGGDPRAERVFVEALAAIKPGIARIHFLDRDITMSTLVAGGGISCRTKAEGAL